MPTCRSWKTGLEHWKWRPYKVRLLVSNSIYARKYRSGTNQDMSPDTAMLFAPFRCTHPPPLIPPFLPKQNLSPKDIAGSDIMKLKVSWWIYPLWALKSFKRWKSGWGPGMMFCQLYSTQFTVISSPRIVLIKVGYGLVHVRTVTVYMYLSWQYALL